MKTIHLNIKEDFQEAIDAIWANPKFQDISILKRGYAIQKQMHKNAILFVGINPSFEEGDNGPVFYDLIDTKPHPYFRKLMEISAFLEENWTHTDLLFCRETNQKKVEDLMKDESGLDFICQQLELSKQMIEEAQPKMIVVNNTLARRFLGFHKNPKTGDQAWMDYSFEFDGTIGTYRIKDNEALNNVPIFFSSMLTGGRALDLGSLERLVWQMGRALLVDASTEIEELKEWKTNVINTQKYEEAAKLRDSERSVAKQIKKRKEKLNQEFIKRA